MSKPLGARTWTALFHHPDSALGYVGWGIEGVLGLGLLLRAVCHVLGYLTLRPEAEHPLDVEYGLVGFHVVADAEGSRPSAGEQVEVACATAFVGAIVGWYRLQLGFGGAPDPVLWFLAANWAVLLADPLVVTASLGWKRYRTTPASETAMEIH